MAAIDIDHSELRTCNCGCGLQYPAYRGLMSYDDNAQVAYRLAHLEDDDGPHLWTMLGIGPWVDSDDVGSWIVLHTWLAETEIVTRVEDWANSPFTKNDAFGERLLDRAEVLSRPGVLDWATERRDELSTVHGPTRDFLSKAIAAHPSGR